MLADCPPIAFIATADGARSRRFYEGMLGLRLLSEDDFSVVFDLQGSQLRIQKVQQLAPQPHAVLGWVVSSIDDAVARLTGKGVVFERYAFIEQDGRGIWTAPSGARVAWLKDPDGNVLSLTETQRV